MRTETLKLALPYPPSANRYWRTSRAGHTYVSAEAKAYKEHVGWLFASRRFEPFEGPVDMTIRVFRPRKSRDLSNCIKVMEDALQGILYLDDAQVIAHHNRLFEDERKDPLTGKRLHISKRGFVLVEAFEVHVSLKHLAVFDPTAYMGLALA